LVKTVALIPARGGSKGVPGKNLRRIGGVPLVARSVAAALSAPSIDAVYVSTDDEAIAAAARRAGASVIARPLQLSGDTASSESALLHALSELRAQGVEPETLVFMQCTSPFTTGTELETALGRLRDGADVAFAVIPSHAFIWKGNPDGTLSGANHESSVRLRRQDMASEWRETGAFYAMKCDGFIAAEHRFFGRVVGVPVEESLALDIDTQADLSRADELVRAPFDLPFVPQALVMDFDGVFTANTVYLNEEGVESVRCDRGDGMGVSLLREAGLPMFVLSTETNKVVAARASKLKLPVLHGRSDKLTDLREWLSTNGHLMERTIYIGNDVNDVGCLREAGFAVAPADAHPTAKAVADHVLSRNGGCGAIRELADLLLPLLESNP
jgi:N-acylneuraminate cytidylyltransferase